MANNKNLKPCEYKLTSEDSAKGGRISGEVRRARRKLRDDLEYLLAQARDGKTNQEMIAEAIIAKALIGDVRAFETIRDTAGEKPTDNVSLSGEVGTLTDADRELLREARQTYAAGD